MKNHTITDSNQAENFLREIKTLTPKHVYGAVTAIKGLLVEISGLNKELSIGGRCDIYAKDGRKIPCEVVGFKSDHALTMPFGTLEGIGLGCKAELNHIGFEVHPTKNWLGRVVNALGEEIDDKGSLPHGAKSIPLKNAAPPAHRRQRVGKPLNLGIRALNSFLTCCNGQRMGIFAGSGVGKSTVLSMMARQTEADVTIIGLVGERGREVQEFIEDDLGEDGLKRSIIVVATSDEPPLMRRQAAYMTLALAEYFRAEGKNVLCMIDSVTRFAMAQREIGLSAGEPPTAKGYPPTTFTELARLLERAGPGIKNEGSITGLFTVLVEGDDHNEPISDAVRGILDGHIVLDRKIAERNRYPAINILKSVSRSMPACNKPEETALINEAKRHISTYEDMAELIRIGAYKKGSDQAVDRAIDLFPSIENFLRQNMDEVIDPKISYNQLAEILGYAKENTENATQDEA